MRRLDFNYFFPLLFFHCLIFAVCFPGVLLRIAETVAGSCTSPYLTIRSPSQLPPILPFSLLNPITPELSSAFALHVCNSAGNSILSSFKISSSASNAFALHKQLGSAADACGPTACTIAEQQLAEAPPRHGISDEANEGSAVVSSSTEHVSVFCDE
jgi:hypothetical protein